MDRSRQPQDNFQFETLLYRQGRKAVGGCDEAGRGPLAGPVVAACIVLPQTCDHSLFLDSKILSEKKRTELFRAICELTDEFGIGIVGPTEIDKVNILRASLLAMKIACENIPSNRPDYLLVDGKFPVPLPLDQLPMIKGESKSASIAAASILAKVTRDRLMDSLHEQYPVYNFRKHKGYPTREHRAAIAAFGPCPIHRLTFKGVKEYVR